MSALPNVDCFKRNWSARVLKGALALCRGTFSLLQVGGMGARTLAVRIKSDRVAPLSAARIQIAVWFSQLESFSLSNIVIVMRL
jgi:hypothetical protein